MIAGPLRRALLLLGSAGLGAFAVVAFMGFRHLEAPWMLDRDHLLVALLLAGAYVVGLLLLRLPVYRARGIVSAFLRTMLIGALVCLPVALLIPLGDLELQKLTLLSGFALVFVLLLLHGLLQPAWLSLLFVAAIAAVGLYPSVQPAALARLAELVRGEVGKDGPPPDYILTPLHLVKAITYRATPAAKGGNSDPGGAFELLDDRRLLLVDGRGDFYLIELSPDGLKSTRLTQPRTAMNAEAYYREAKNPSRFFRVMDILLDDPDGDRQATIYVASFHWDSTAACSAVSVDEAAIDLNNLDRPLAWTNRFRATPCMSGSISFHNETGGRLALLPDGRLLVTVGVVYGNKDAPTDATDPAQSYGKIIAIDRKTWTSRIYSLGLRNPQGLLVEGDTVWSTDHGPDGGDELNVVLEDGDYGWPTASFGADYGTQRSQDNDQPGRHLKGITPVFAWVPSIGISRLIRAKGTMFRAWRDDLLIGSLSGRGHGYSIYRVRITDGRVVLAERIPLGVRVRDLAELPSGEIVIWDGSNQMQIISPGRNAFEPCASCHAVTRGFEKGTGIGPDLYGVVNRDVAALRKYDYSAAMRAYGGRWSPERLDYFLRDPEAAVPGTTMAVPGIADASQRREIIEFLQGIQRQ